MQDDLNNIDDIFRNTLKDSREEPPAYIWDNIVASIPKKAFFSSPNVKYFSIAASIVVMSVLTFIAYYYFNNQSSNVADKVAVKNIKAPTTTERTNTDKVNNIHQENVSHLENVKHFYAAADNKSSDKPRDINNDEAKPKTKAEAKNKAKELNKPVVEKRADVAKVKKASEDKDLTAKTEINAPKPEAVSKEENKAADVQKTEVISQTTENKITEQAIVINKETAAKNESKAELINKNTATEAVTNNNTIALPLISNHYLQHRSNPLIASVYNLEYDSKLDQLHNGESSMRRKNSPDIYLGLSYTPEYYISRSDFLSKTKDFANSADMSISFIWNQFSLRTGLGLSLYRTDKFDYQVNYVRNEAVGSYNKVDSVTFRTQDNVVVPEFHTSEVTVYDDVNHIYRSQIKNKYAYLQIPLIFGYKLNELKNISFTLNCGPVISLTLSKQAEEITYPGNGVKVITVYSNEVSRLNSYWDMMLSLGMNYMINSRFSFNLEPQFRTGVSSVYSASNTQNKKPYSIGLRTGIMYKL